MQDYQCLIIWGDLDDLGLQVKYLFLGLSPGLDWGAKAVAAAQYPVYQA